MPKLRRSLVSLLLLCCLASAAIADTVANWEAGFEVDVPNTWLRQEGGLEGMKLASDDVRLDITTYGGLSFDEEIQRLHRETKASGYEFKTERTFTINQVPAHEMIFYKSGRYKIFYVLLAGTRGFLLTLQSDGTDSSSFLQAQDIIGNFRVTPLR